MNDSELEKMAQDAEHDVEGQFVRRKRQIEDFRYDEIQEKYWDTTTGTLLGAKSVNGAISREDWPTTLNEKGKVKRIMPAEAINDVDTGLTVEGSTWWPGLPRFINDRTVSIRGAMVQKGAVTYNTYVPPDRSNLSQNENPDMWIEHIKFLFPDPVEHEHFFDFAAHMIQRPDEKINHGIVMGGGQGIGKDTALLPLRKGVGEWNTAEIEPDAISRPWNTFVQSVLLMINEVRPHDEDHKASNFYNQLKPYLAAPPEMMPMEAKYANVIFVRNLCHVILTTNDPLTMYIPESDRRLFVMTSRLPDPKRAPVFSANYFDKMHKYLQKGGNDAIIRWLNNRDIRSFDVAAPPPMTQGKREIIESSEHVRRTAIDELLEEIMKVPYFEENSSVIFAADLADFVNKGNVFDDKEPYTRAIKARNLHFKMDERGYAAIRNPDAAEFKRGKFRSRVAFVDKTLPQDEAFSLVLEELNKRPLAWEHVQ